MLVADGRMVKFDDASDIVRIFESHPGAYPVLFAVTVTFHVPRPMTLARMLKLHVSSAALYVNRYGVLFIIS